ncbi:MAG: peptidoglycan-binding protein [Clostridia bacterium]|nr:peptidoglycan-binding protein [Clostridia bacterium]
MKNVELVKKAKDVVANYKTVYANGMFGQPITESIIVQKTRQLPKWYTSARQKSLRALIGQGCFGFDCICFIKALLWGWSGDLKSTNGGAKYCSNNVPDTTEYGMLNRCSNISSDFSKIEVGEYLWTDGHCGIYVGEGMAVECTPKWDNGVQITAVHNIAEKQGYNGRTWKKHGKLPYIEYIVETEEETKKMVTINLSRLQRGSKGNEVKTLQRLLKSLGYDIGWFGTDGDFGSATEAAVKKFQQDRKIASDGIVGCDTWMQLLLFGD